MAYDASLLDVRRQDPVTLAITSLPHSMVTLTTGYAIGAMGELSLDPPTALVSMSTRLAYPMETLFPDVAYPGDRVEIIYGSTVLFRGIVGDPVIGVETDPEHIGRYIRQVSYSMVGLEADLVNLLAEWSTLPSESALVRLERWFTVSTERMPAEMLADLDVVLPAETTAGSATYLDLIRQFSEQTGYPLRVRIGSTWTETALTDLEVFPVTIRTGLGDALDWIYSARFSVDAVGGVVPSTAEALTNDLRLSGGVEVISTGTQPRIGSTFRVGVSRIGVDPQVPIGFRAPDGVDIFGYQAPVSRVSQSFGPKYYKAALEFAPGAHPTVVEGV